MPAMKDGAKCAVAGVRKPPRNEPAVVARKKCHVLGYEDLFDVGGAWEGSQCAP